MRALLLSLACCLGLGLVGCPDADDSDDSSSTSEQGKSTPAGPGGTSPADAYEQFRATAKIEGFRARKTAELELLSPAERRKSVASLARQAEACIGKDDLDIIAKIERLDSLYRTHGLEWNQPPPPRQAAQLYASFAKRAEDVDALNDSLLAYIDENASPKQKKKLDRPPDVELGEHLEQLKVEGGRAAAVVELSMLEGTQPQTARIAVKLVREDGRWFLDGFDEPDRSRVKPYIYELR